MEDFGSMDESPDDFCRRKVAECDLFVCIAGPLYGSRSPAGASFTEREFDSAVCEVTGSSGWRPLFMPEDATKSVSKTKTKKNARG